MQVGVCCPSPHDLQSVTAQANRMHQYTKYINITLMETALHKRLLFSGDHDAILSSPAIKLGPGAE